MTDIELDAIVIILGIAYILTRRKKKRVGRKSCDSYMNRVRFGHYHNLLSHFRMKEPAKFMAHLRLSTSQFDELLSKIEPKIKKQDTNCKIAISAGERLAMTLRYLASGESQTSIATSYAIGDSTMCGIVREVCDAIYESLAEECLPSPHTLYWNMIAKGFEDRWNFPNCLGALDGKHIQIQAPPGSGSEYFNYKNSFSIVMMAACDADYCFTMLDIGAAGRESDGGIFARSQFFKALQKDRLGIPPPRKLKDSQMVLPHVFVADEAFPLHSHMLRPYPGRGTGRLSQKECIFNYRLSRARRTIENAFGILSGRFRLLRTVQAAHPEHVVIFVKACVVLHNFVMKSRNDNATNSTFVDEDSASVFSERQNTLNDRNVRDAASVRQHYADYFVGEGAVDWRNEHVSRIA